jgi:hypothetical protein
VANVPQAQKSFRTHPIELLGDVDHVKSHFSPFGDSVSISGSTRILFSVCLETVLISVQDRCTVSPNVP